MVILWLNLAEKNRTKTAQKPHKTFFFVRSGVFTLLDHFVGLVVFCGVVQFAFVRLAW